MKKAKPTETTTTYNIERGIEIPPIARRGSIQQALREMGSGDSVLVESRKVTGWRIAARRLGVAIVTRRVDDDNTRVWLTK